MMKKVKRRSREEVAIPDIQGWAQFPMQDEERKIQSMLRMRRIGRRRADRGVQPRYLGLGPGGSEWRGDHQSDIRWTH